MTEPLPLAAKRCLVVEDEFLIAMDYERILQGAGADIVLSADRLARAEEILRDHGPVDIALLDLHLHGESSLPFAVRLAEQGTPVVIITGMSPDLALPEALKAVQVVSKPFEERTLVAAVLRALGQAQ